MKELPIYLTPTELSILKAIPAGSEERYEFLDRVAISKGLPELLRFAHYGVLADGQLVCVEEVFPSDATIRVS